MATKKRTKVAALPEPKVVFEANDLVYYTDYDDGRGNPRWSTTYGRVVMIEGDWLVVRTEEGLATWFADSTKKSKI